MQKFFSLFIILFLSACSGVSTKQPSPYSTSVLVVPGKIVQIELPSYYEKSSIKCTSGTFPVSKGENPFFIYAESYFSDMKDKKCIGENLEIKIC